MSFDKSTRNLLARTITACRRRLVEDVTDQLSGVFGLHPDGTVLKLDKLTYLSPDQVVGARSLRDLLEHYTAGAAGTESDQHKVAYERLILEISFTILNRLIALRLCEERDLVVECVRQGTASDGFRLFERVSGGALGDRYNTYRVFIECLFDELALDLGVLFDLRTPLSVIFPSERCMEDILAELNKLELMHLWTEDETIGWVYQYFNPLEERKAMRNASQAPRNGRELAVRNQFFTPRYVVEFLTDNTLGRIWYEMRKGDTALKEDCRYLVRRPNEVFLGPGEKAPEEQLLDSDLSQEELLNKTVYIEHRPKKDPRELRILDPACGSGHFLLYAFDLLERIYEEAWMDQDSPVSESLDSTLCKDLNTIDDLHKMLPKLIIEHNLHGIDIDPRAVQIAALALWLRAQKNWKNINIKAAERPQIAKSNIVTAESMPGEADMKEEFTDSLRPRVLGQLVDVVFEKMKLAGEAGSLLKIEKEIEDAVTEARKQWLGGTKPEQLLLFPDMPDPRPQQQELRFDVKSITDKRFWEQAEDSILEALRNYSELAEGGYTVRRRLFVEDTARGFAFIDLCRKRYDVVLMNPPFGEVSTCLLGYLAGTYPTWNKNILCSFIERGYQMSHPMGATAAIYDRTAIVKSTYEDFRRTVLVPDNRLSAMVDLGWGVLDANVEITTSVLHHQPATDEGVFIDCREINVDKKGSLIKDSIDNLFKGIIRKMTVNESGTTFQHLPNSVIGYDFPRFLRLSFESFLSLEQSGLKANQGFALKAAKHFRVWWEVHFDSSMVINRMFNGAGYSPYITALYDVAISSVEPEDLPMNSSTRKSGIGSHRKMGICFGKRGDYFCCHVLPKGHIFTVEGQSIPVLNKERALEALGLINTPLIRYSLNKYCGQHKYSGYVNLLPYRRLTNIEKCRESVSSAIDSIRGVQRYDEIQTLFSCIPYSNSIKDSANAIVSSIDFALKASANAEALCHVESLKTYEVSEVEQEEIESFYKRQPRIELPIEDADFSSGCLWFSAHSIASIAIGIIFGRWDIRVATDPSLAPKLSNPFEPLPICPPGMLVGPDGLPATPSSITSEEWLHARPDANNLPLENTVKSPTIPCSDYPLRISWDGILVDDLCFNGNQPHREDIIYRIREVLDLLWKDKAHEIEQEACNILGVKILRDYFRRPSGFFQDHLKRYSKSRRKAPIYWPLSTSSGSYTIWIYYHRLTDQTLYTVVNNYVEPKIAEIERAITHIEDDLSTSSGHKATRLTDMLDEMRAFLRELREFREDLLRIAALPYKPNLNDGVIINAAPFHKLFRLQKWANDTKKVWDKLEKGDYDWAHLAYTIWPERVRKVCMKDRSIAISHGLVDICEIEVPTTKKRGRRSKKGN